MSQQVITGETIETQIARLDERFKAIEKLIPVMLDKLERKIDEMTGKLSSEYVKRAELDKILDERKSSIATWQNLLVGIVMLILAALVSAGMSKL